MNAFNILRYVPMWMLYLLAHSVVFLLRLYPKLSILHTIEVNLLLVYPELNPQKRRALAFDSLKNQIFSMAESLKSWAMPPKWSSKQITSVHHADILTTALQNPNGMLAIVPHLGTWEMMNAWLNEFGSPTIMYKPVKGKKANEFVLQGRQRLNATLVPTDASGVKAMFKTLKSGGFSIILPDHVPDESGGVVAPFYRIPTLSSTLASKLASKTQCALVGLTCVRRPDGKGFEVYCDNLNDPQLYSKDTVIATTALNHALAQMINRFPNHYMWSYKRFKKNALSREDIYWLPLEEVAALREQISLSYHHIN